MIVSKKIKELTWESTGMGNNAKDFSLTMCDNELNVCLYYTML